jgi:glycerate 2-kinase
MHFLIAPDKFKGSLTALEAAQAIAVGVRRLHPEAKCELCPIADGGEGFMETLIGSLRGEWITCPAVDALGREISSRYVLAQTSQGPTAILEMAETAGLWRLSAVERNPLITSTAGTGLQIAHAIKEHRVTRIILGLGGSATNDGGSGMAHALGVRFLTTEGCEIKPTPTTLGEVTQVDFSTRISLPEIIAACDVDNPLLGPRGATAIFSAQKGASPADQELLETSLAHLVKICAAETAANTPGTGAAGGLGMGLLHFAGAQLVSGFDLLADLLDLEKRIAAADHVITGEGSLDHQSLAGKGPVALARLALSHGKPVSGYCGQADAAARNSGIFTQLHALADTGLPLDTLIAEAGPRLTELVSHSNL